MFYCFILSLFCLMCFLQRIAIDWSLSSPQSGQLRNDCSVSPVAGFLQPRNPHGAEWYRVWQDSPSAITGIHRTLHCFLDISTGGQMGLQRTPISIHSLPLKVRASAIWETQKLQLHPHLPPPLTKSLAYHCWPWWFNVYEAACHWWLRLEKGKSPKFGVQCSAWQNPGSGSIRSCRVRVLTHL